MLPVWRRQEYQQEAEQRTAVDAMLVQIRKSQNNTNKLTVRINQSGSQSIHCVLLTAEWAVHLKTPEKNADGPAPLSKIYHVVITRKNIL